MTEPRTESLGRRAVNRLLPALAGLALLVLMLGGALFSLAAGYGLPVDPATLAAAAVWLGLAVTLVCSLPRLRGTVFLLLSAGWAVLCWAVRGWLLPAWRALAEAACAQLSLSADLSALPAGEVTGVACALAFALLAAPWAALLGWCLLRGHAPLLALLLTWPLLLPSFVINAPLVWPALLAMLAAQLAFLCSARAARTDAVGGAKLTLLLLPLVALFLCALTALSPEAGYQMPGWAETAQVRLLEWVATLPDPFAEGEGLGSARPAQLSETVDLTEAGAPAYSGAAVLELDSERTGLIYLRGYSMAVYTGTGWTPLPEEAYDEILPWPGPGGLGEGASWLDLLSAYPPALYPAAAQSGAGTEETLTVRDLSTPTGWVYAPYQLTGLGGTGAAADTHLARDGGQWQHRFSYQAASLSGLSALTGETAQAEQLYQDFVRAYYLSLPEGLADRLSSWVDRVEYDYLPGGLETASSLPRRYQETVARALAVAALLEDTAVYDLDVPALPAGEDAAVWFLEESGRGYCMHFATAGAALLRAMGIPARYVAGYAAPVAEAGRTQVPDSAAHAWVEIYLEGYGWYPVEMTPAAGLPSAGTAMPDDTAEETPETPEEDPSEPQMEEEAPETPEETPAGPQETPETPEEQAPSLLPGTGGTGASEGGAAFDLAGLLLAAGRTAAALALAAALVLGGRRLYRALLRRRFAPLHHGGGNECAIALYALLEDLGRWGGQMPEEATRLAQKARFSQHRLTGEEVAALRRLFREERSRTERALPRWKRPLFYLLWHEPRQRERRSRHAR